MFSFIKSMKFRRAIDRALADHVITDAEITAIDRLQEELGLADGKAQAEYEKKVGSLTRKLTDRVVARVRNSRRFSPEDEEEIMEICRQLQVTPNLQIDFHVYRKLWEVRSEEHTSELQSLMRISYAVFCL